MRRLHLAISRRLTAFAHQVRVQPERGDVPGWVLIVAMTVALVMLVWGIAQPALKDLIQNAMDKAHF
jgi:hypothetical protein